MRPFWGSVTPGRWSDGQGSERAGTEKGCSHGIDGRPLGPGSESRTHSAWGREEGDFSSGPCIPPFSVVTAWLPGKVRSVDNSELVPAEVPRWLDQEAGEVQRAVQTKWPMCPVSSSYSWGH